MSRRRIDRTIVPMSSPGEDPAIHGDIGASGSMGARVEPAHDT